MNISELYGKKIISADGRVLGDVQGLILDFGEGEVSHLLLDKIGDLEKSEDLRNELAKKSIMYKRVRKVSETIIVSAK